MLREDYFLFSRTGVPSFLTVLKKFKYQIDLFISIIEVGLAQVKAMKLIFMQLLAEMFGLLKVNGKKILLAKVLCKT